jgi:hypothetical protein
MDHQRRSAAGRVLTLAAVGGAAGAALMTCGPHPAELPTSLDALARTMRAAPTTVVVDLAAAAAWLCLGWLCCGALLTALGAVPSRLGRVCAAASRLITPRLLRTAVEAACGVAVAAGPVISAVPGYAAPAAASTAATGAADFDWPVTTAAQPGTNLDWPAAPGAPFHPATAGAATRTPETHPAGGRERRPHVVVRPGDTLWAIAAAALPADASNADIAVAWPRWYAANRAEIGPDPNLLLPGERLRPPQPSQAPPSPSPRASRSPR